MINNFSILNLIYSIFENLMCKLDDLREYATDFTLNDFVGPENDSFSSKSDSEHIRSVELPEFKFEQQHLQDFYKKINRECLDHKKNLHDIYKCVLDLSNARRDIIRAVKQLDPDGRDYQDTLTLIKMYDEYADSFIEDYLMCLILFKQRGISKNFDIEINLNEYKK